ncbi:unnamed protein product [Lepeophtheirus salmonis]|uniref:(salmon louse) hypothetical protein n=1 Tax=Lepeophtheirus salmonis TaxID=72036 RepID=A0A7R8CS55_LEPSM|nr:unnamed protein product [Lepeophtheirus salmonis]CAF2910801.1 unnamed protein product [Lepeophtheirus salmonis]
MTNRWTDKCISKKKILMNKENVQNQGLAFLTMMSAEDEEGATSKFNGTKDNGQEAKVEITHQGSRRGFRGGGYRGVNGGGRFGGGDGNRMEMVAEELDILGLAETVEGNGEDGKRDQY